MPYAPSGSNRNRRRRRIETIIGSEVRNKQTLMGGYERIIKQKQV
jgi:hypothetical protein